MTHILNQFWYYVVTTVQLKRVFELSRVYIVFSVFRDYIRLSVLIAFVVVGNIDGFSPRRVARHTEGDVGRRSVSANVVPIGRVTILSLEGVLRSMHLLYSDLW